jgi:hypothetical protein
MKPKAWVEAAGQVVSAVAAMLEALANWPLFTWASELNAKS